MTSMLGGVRARLRKDEPAARFLDRPFATVQLLILCGVGLLGFGVLMAVSTTIAAAHTGGGSIWGQSVKEAEFIAIGLVLFWFAARMSPRGFRYLAYPVLAMALVALVAVGVGWCRGWWGCGGAVGGVPPPPPRAGGASPPL